MVRELGSEVGIDHFLLTQFSELTWNTSDRPINATRGFLALLRGPSTRPPACCRTSTSSRRWSRRAATCLCGAERRWPDALKLGFAQPYGNSDVVPFNVRFYAGGPGSIRGFGLNRVGPQATDGAPLGGHSLIEGSLELRFAAIGELGGVLFVDFGQVFGASLDYDLEETALRAVGPGIRYNTPIGPVRFDVGFIMYRRPDEPFGHIELSILQGLLKAGTASRETTTWGAEYFGLRAPSSGCC